VELGASYITKVIANQLPEKGCKVAKYKAPFHQKPEPLGEFSSGVPGAT